MAPSNGGSLEYDNESIGIPRDQLSGITVNSDTSLTATTPQVLAGTNIVTACTVSGCSEPTQKTAAKVQFTFYLPGNPVVTHVVPRRGPASGGNVVEILGRNLSDPVSVTFGKRAGALNAGLEGLPPGIQISIGGSANSIEVAAPPGYPGETVKVRVTTAESEFAPGGVPSAVTTATTYTYFASPPSAPQKVHTRERAGNVRVSWTKPLVDGGSKITGYRIILHSINLFARKQPKPIKITVGPKARSVVFPHLRPQVYVVDVRAINKLGKGPVGQAQYPKNLLNELLGF